MPQLTEDIHRSQISNQQFLFSKTDIGAETQTSEPPPIISIEKIKETFPEILIEDIFHDNAMALVGDAKTFGALVIRLDDINYVINPNDVIADLAGIIDAICGESSGIWGLVDQATLGCFFPETNETQCLGLSKKIKENLSQKCGETVSVGIAVYPTLSYTKNTILKNSKKALDHADFFGADSCVAFDSVSLNISGDKFYQAGDLEGAMNEFDLALKLDENNINVHNSLGVCYGIKEDLNKALSEFKTAIRLDPKENMAIYNAGYVYFLKKEYTTALEYFQKSEQIDDMVFELAIQTGRIYLELNQTENAKKYLKKATDLNPKSAAGFRLLGDTYTNLDRISDAITAYKTTLKLNPEDAEALSALGYLYEIQEKNADIALMFCRQGIEIAPDNGLFRHRLGRLYLNRNRVEEALDEFQKAQKLGHKSDEYIAKTLKLISLP
ncbi:MAG: tetratricopeptide repeat protein [Desulfobacteraceae bacterium]|nr:tetratricopeptide repeat protein [Desulfobacteraceae bacterium]MBC2754948.1 tetratricopeptide repeat protein [Desulfobacteraceae bacterium]